MFIGRRVVCGLLISLVAASCAVHADSLSEKGNGAIIGGYDAEPGKWPWMVSLHAPRETYDYNGTPIDAGVLDASDSDEFKAQGQVGTSMQHICGGSLIRPQWVLTAAHCVEDGGVFEIRQTASKLSEADNIIPVNEVIVHPEWDPRTSAADLALLRLQRPLPLGGNYPTVATALLEQRFGDPGTRATTLGWGIVDDFNETLPDALQELRLLISPEQVCDKYATAEDGDEYLYYDHSSMICAGFFIEDKGTCGGDSGGPLFVIDDAARALLVGITSWGEECGGRNNYLEGFTRVSRYHAWITEVTAGPPLHQPQ